MKLSVMNRLCLIIVILFLTFDGFVAFCLSRQKVSSMKQYSTTVQENIKSSETLTETNKLPWKGDGYKFWNWKGYKINYVDLGQSDSADKPPLLLVHGFGASVYHWRYNIPALSEKYHVFALDLLGFGLSDKPLIEYDASVWRDQILAFIEEIIHAEIPSKVPCVVAGNSLGGFAALYASSENADLKNLIRGCILLNAAGRFKDPDSVVLSEDTRPGWIQAVSAAFQRFIINLSFIYTKQPLRVKQILQQVYINPDNVDDELVESIVHPAKDPNAPEVFYRIISRNGNGPTKYIDDLLDNLKGLPLLLLWGENDPWIRPKAADRIQELYPSAQRVNVNAGHCPHDEIPEKVNEEMIRFIDSLSA